MAEPADADFDLMDFEDELIPLRQRPAAAPSPPDPPGQIPPPPPPPGITPPPPPPPVHPRQLQGRRGQQGRGGNRPQNDSLRLIHQLQQQLNALQRQVQGDRPEDEQGPLEDDAPRGRGQRGRGRRRAGRHLGERNARTSHVQNKAPGVVRGLTHSYELLVLNTGKASTFVGLHVEVGVEVEDLSSFSSTEDELDPPSLPHSRLPVPGLCSPPSMMSFIPVFLYTFRDIGTGGGISLLSIS